MSIQVWSNLVRLVFFFFFLWKLWQSSFIYLFPFFLHLLLTRTSIWYRMSYRVFKNNSALDFPVYFDFMQKIQRTGIELTLPLHRPTHLPATPVRCSTCTCACLFNNRMKAIRGKINTVFSIYNSCKRAYLHTN